MTQALQNTPDNEAVIAVNLSKIRTAQETAASHHGALRNVMKHAEGKGVHLKAAKRALSIIKAGDPDTWLEETAEITRYLRIMRHGVTSNQLNLDFGTTLEPLDDKAKLDGRAAGLDMAATEHDNPHGLDTKPGQAWLDAFRQGRSERDIILSMAESEPEPDDETDADDEAA